MNDLESTKEFASRIDGWLTEKEGELLYNLAKATRRNGVIVEIGSWKGKSTVFLGRGSQSGDHVKIYAIDPHTGSPEHKKEYGHVRTFAEFKKNIENSGIDGLIIPEKKTSREAADNFEKPVELLFIDGAHEYEAVKMDFELWIPKLLEGGTVTFHDAIGYPRTGPGKVVEKYVFKSNSFKNIRIVDSIVCAEKVSNISTKEKSKNRYVFALKKISEIGIKLNLPKPLRAIGKKLLSLIN
jgi:predicted O-methyltransferase YrrM